MFFQHLFTIAMAALPIGAMDALDCHLQACLDVNNAVRKAAEEALRALSAQPQVVPDLLQRIQSSQDAQVRQLAAVLLRKRVSRHWAQLSPEARRHTQQILMQQLAAEQVHPVSRSLADVTSVVAQLSANGVGGVGATPWPELMVFLNQCSAQQSAHHREIALMLFTALAENIGEHLLPAFADVASLVGRGLADPQEGVRSAALHALLALGVLASTLGTEKEVAVFQGLVGMLLQTTTEALKAPGHEETAVLACQVLLELVECPAPLLQPHLPNVVAVCMEAALQRHLALETREQALQVLHWIARHKPKQLSRDKALMRRIVEALCGMCCEPDPPEYDDVSDVAPSAMGAQALDTLACHCASTAVHPQVLAFAKQSCHSADADVRHGGLITLAAIAEGCAEALRRKVAEALPLVLRGLQDPAQKVRGAAAFALGQFSEYLQPEIVQHYEAVLPALFGVMEGAEASVQERVCYALDAFCSSLEQEILPFMPQLMERLVGVLRSHASHDMQDMALSALASIVAAAGKDVTPYAASLLPILQHYLTASHAELLPCRCHATECAGLVLEGLGAAAQAGSAEARALLAASVPGFMQQALQGFEVVLPPSAKATVNELREYGHGLCACVAKALGADFAPYLQYCLPLALQSIALDDGTAGGSDGEGEEGAKEQGAAGALGGISDDEEEDDDGKGFSVHTGVMEEKAAATAALGMYAQYCMAALAPQTQPILEALLSMADYFNEEVRAPAYEGLSHLLVAAHELWPAPAGSATPFSAETQHLLSRVAPALLEGLEDGDKHATALAIGALGKVLRHLGVAALAGPAAEGDAKTGLQVLAEGTAAVLAGKASCHEEDGEDGDEEDESGGNIEAEEELLAAACDLLPVLASAAGPAAYAPVFEALHMAPLLGRLKPRQPEDLRAVALGAIAEVAEVLQARLVPHLEKLMPTLLRELRAADAVNRQNSAFCCGVLVEGCGAVAVRPYLQQLLQALHPLFGEEEDAGTRDNATGAVARLLLTAGAELPVEQVVPIFLKGLPLKEDLREAVVVYRALAKLTTAPETSARVLPLAAPIIHAFAAASVQPGLPSEALGEVGRAMVALQVQHRQQLEALVQSLPAEQQQGLARLMAAAAAQ